MIFQLEHVPSSKGQSNSHAVGKDRARATQYSASATGSHSLSGTGVQVPQNQAHQTAVHMETHKKDGKGTKFTRSFTYTPPTSNHPRSFQSRLSKLCCFGIQTRHSMSGMVSSCWIAGCKQCAKVRVRPCNTISSSQNLGTLPAK